MFRVPVPRRYAGLEATKAMRRLEEAGPAVSNERGKSGREPQDRRDVLRLEQALAEAERACRARDEMLSTAAHALRTPLTAILGWVNLLRTGELDAATSARAVETIERNARRQAEIIADLIDAARILSGRLRLVRGRVDLVRVVEAALGPARAAAEAKDLRWHAALDPAAAPVWGDPDRLQQVVTILLSNAVKFTPAGGRIEVRLERVDGGAEVRVRDEGAGIPAPALPRLFDCLPQVQPHGESGGSRGQLGLRLPIAWHLAELHGGTLTAASEGAGRGATFTLRLPLRLAGDTEAPADEPASVPLTGPRLEGVRVLLVSDPVPSGDEMAGSLGGCGAVTATAESAEEAMRELAGFAPDVIVVDLEMSGEQGYRFIEQVRDLAVEQGGRTPAVALTAYGRAQDRLRTLRAGFQIHVSKPVRPLELATVVASLGSRSG